jgi:hypothetical protein
MISPQATLASTRELPDYTPRVTLVPDGLIVEWNAPPPRFSESADGRSVVEMPGFVNTAQPGAPRVPSSSVLVAIPAGVMPVIERLTSTETIEYLNSPLALGDQPSGVELSSEGQIIGGSFIPATQEVQGALEPITLEHIGILRGVNLARLSFFPVLSIGESLRLTTYIKVKVTFAGQQRSARALQAATDPLLAVVKSAVINPEHLQIASPDVSADEPSPTLQLAEKPTAVIEVSKPGITELSYSDLAAAGFPVDSTNPNLLHLTHAGNAVAYQWQGDSDQVFNPGEKIRFFADPRFSRWTSSDTYFLSNENTTGLRMQSRVADAGITPGIPWVEVLFEENAIYTPVCYCAPIPVGRDGDRWVWDRLQRPSPFEGTYKFQLNGVDNSQPAELTVWFIGFTQLNANPDHYVDINLNGHVLGTKQWDGKNAFQADFSFSGSFLQEGENTLTVTLPEIPGISINGVWMDAFSIRHARSANLAADEVLLFSGENSRREYTFSVPSGTGMSAYDVTNSDLPVIMTGIPAGATSVTLSDPQPFSNPNHRYWIGNTNLINPVDNLRMVSQSRLSPDFKGADYLIISPAELIPSLSDLVDLHQSNGLVVAVEDVQAIYDIYGDGRPIPTAIKAFLADAYFSWNKPPVYVLLVGDGTHDPKGYLSSSFATLIPPFLADVDPWMGETASDNRYVTVDGEDFLPDMLIGRLPANNPIELGIMVSKIVQHETQTPSNLWQHQALFVADDTDSQSGDFASLSDILIDQFPTHPFAPQRLYYVPNQTTPEEFRSNLLQAWNAGSGLIMYTGHSAISYWAHEIFFHLVYVPNLENRQKLPVLLEMTCFTGSFQIPDLQTLDEVLLSHQGGGAVAAWGSTGLGVSTGHHWLAEGFMKTIYQDGLSEIGLATLAGKMNLASVGVNLDLIDTFNLLGDPATKLERSYQIFMPLTQN